MSLVTKVFIVDDHYMVIEGIRSLLEHEKGIEWMGHAMNAESCLAFLNNRQPDVIFMDINLPDKSGIDLCKEVNQAYPAISIIGLSTFNQHSFITRMMENGASGYVLKNATKEELLFAIQTVVRGHTFLSHEAAASPADRPAGNPPGPCAGESSSVAACRSLWETSRSRGRNVLPKAAGRCRLLSCNTFSIR